VRPTRSRPSDGRVHLTAPREKQQPSPGRGFTGANIIQRNLATDCEAGQGVRLTDRATLGELSRRHKITAPLGKKSCLCCSSPSSKLRGLSLTATMAREQEQVLPQGQAGSATSRCPGREEQRRHRQVPRGPSPCRERGVGRAKAKRRME